jgi:hypothetical protein
VAKVMNQRDQVGSSNLLFIAKISRGLDGLNSILDMRGDFAWEPVPDRHTYIQTDRQTNRVCST